VKLVYPDINSVFQITTDYFHQLVIENPVLFRHFTEDIYEQCQGLDGYAVLSEQSVPVSFSSCTEFISQFVPFEINRKEILTKILSVMETQSADAEFVERSARLLADLERLIQDVSFSLPGNIEGSKISMGSVLKAAGIRICDDYENPLEKILDFMDLSAGYNKKKFFFFVNMRSYFSNDEMEKFTASALHHGHLIFLLDNAAGEKLSLEKRTTIDRDLCEF